MQTWGHASSATMNWRVAYSDTDFFIPAGFPIAFIRPFDFRLVQDMEVDLKQFSDLDEAFVKDYQGWHEQRDAVLQEQPDTAALKDHKGAYGKNLNSCGRQLPSESFRPFRLPTLNVDEVRDEDSYEPE